MRSFYVSVAPRGEGYGWDVNRMSVFPTAADEDAVLGVVARTWRRTNGDLIVTVRGAVPGSLVFRALRFPAIMSDVPKFAPEPGDSVSVSFPVERTPDPR